MMKKTLMIGIDGATFKIINPLIEQGRLPTFKKLMEKGSYCKLFSTVPSVTCVAWPALITGRNPKNNGIIDWHYYRGNYTEHFFNGRDIKGKKFWDYLGEKKIKCGIVNVPITYPPEKLNGFMITGMLSPGEHANFTYPTKLKEELLKKEYEIDPINRSELSDKVFFDRVINLDKKRGAICVDLLKKKKWDLFFVVFRPEPLQNRFWGEEKMHFVEKAYEEVDNYMKDLIESVKEEVDIILVSDHGFGRTPDYNFYLNRWLQKNKYLYLKKKERLINIEKIYRFFVKIGLGRLKYVIGNMFGTKIKRSLRFINYSEDVSWAQTKAFGRVSEETGFIYLNKVKRFNKGILQEDKIERLRNEIKQKLENLSFNNLKVVKKIKFKEELYGDLNIAPDIIFEINKEFRGMEVTESNIFVKIGKKDKKSWHESDGIFIAQGPSIKNLGEINHSNIIDVTPTILESYNVQKPKEIDGVSIKILKK